MNRIRFSALAPALLAVALTSCGDIKSPSKSNFKKAVQAHLDTIPGLCATPPASHIPFQLPRDELVLFPGKPTLLDRANALVEAGLLSRTGPAIADQVGKGPGYEFTLTEAGQRELVKGAGKNRAAGDAFCSGKYRVTEVMGFTEPAEMFGHKISNVTYRYEVHGNGKWTTLPAIGKAFPEVLQDLGPAPTTKMILVLTSEGWVSDYSLQTK